MNVLTQVCHATTVLLDHQRTKYLRDKTYVKKQFWNVKPFPGKLNCPFANVLTRAVSYCMKLNCERFIRNPEISAKSQFVH